MPPRKKLQRIMFALGIVGAVFLTGEIFIRVAALFVPDVNYLASASFKGRPRSYDSLESFIASQKDLIPRRNWANYFTNELGFNDREFKPGKPPGGYRIMALGDSFCYGMVPYPANIQTLAEAQLDRGCGEGVEILNMGLPGAHTWEYEVLFKLAEPVYEPDLVVIHFYMGNDGPDLVRHLTGVPVLANPIFSSYLISYIRNSMKILKGIEKHSDQGTFGPVQQKPKGDPEARGGQRIDPDLSDPDDSSPSYSQPRFTVPAFAKQMADELVRFHDPGPEAAARDWRPVIGNLEAIRQAAIERGVKAVLVLYPSVLQVYPDRLARTVAEVSYLGRIENFDPDRVDPASPNRFLEDYARRNKMPFLDLTPALIKAAQASAAPLYLNRDTHWNFRGNRVAARAEADFLGTLIRE